MYDWKDKTVGLGILAAGFFAVLSLFHGFGTRKTEEIYSFRYKGKPAAIVCKDVLWGPDEYYFSIGEDRLTGRLVTDDNKEINIFRNWRGENRRYSIRDFKN